MSSIMNEVCRLKALAMRDHYWNDEDCWYSCPKSPDGCCNEEAGDDCRCGADAVNAEVERTFSAIEASINQLETRMAVVGALQSCYVNETGAWMVFARQIDAVIRDSVDGALAQIAEIEETK